MFTFSTEARVLTAVIYAWLTCSLVFTVVDFLSDGVQRDRLLNDVVVIWNLCRDVTGKETCYRLRCWSDTMTSNRRDPALS